MQGALTFYGVQFSQQSHFLHSIINIFASSFLCDHPIHAYVNRLSSLNSWPIFRVIRYLSLTFSFLCSRIRTLFWSGLLKSFSPRRLPRWRRFTCVFPTFRSIPCIASLFPNRWPTLNIWHSADFMARSLSWTSTYKLIYPQNNMISTYLFWPLTYQCRLPKLKKLDLWSVRFHDFNHEQQKSSEMCKEIFAVPTQYLSITTVISWLGSLTSKPEQAEQDGRRGVVEDGGGGESDFSPQCILLL